MTNSNTQIINSLRTILTSDKIKCDTALEVATRAVDNGLEVLSDSERQMVDKIVSKHGMAACSI
jgi:CCR4-NOT transcriptional regulation complex NOT5 subunit